MTTSFRVSFVSFALCFAPLGLFAQPTGPDSNEAQDVPGRGVVRVSLINGDVTVRRGDSGDVIAAAVNAPLVASDRVLTGVGSRTELQFDGANRLRVAPKSDLRLTEIEYRRYTVELGRGTLTWHVSRNSASDIDINTPSASVRPTEPGDYRITVNPDGTTEVTARTGAAEISSSRGVERIRRGRTTLVRGDRSDPELQTLAEIREDDWDRFNLSRDRELDRSGSRQYLADDIVGAEELDHNGTWIDSAPYGRVWQPRVAANWSPYSQGRWVWLDYYGWSWVSYDQFGWAPFHYGSWFYQNTGWCWYPGPLIGRNWWRPAMVAWFGFGGVGVGVGFGNLGWVPLAPFERFRPWYGQGFYGNRTNVFNNIRVVNNYNIVNNYRNARVDGGARAVEAGQFGRSGGRFDRVGETNLRSAGLMQGQLPATPARESLAFNDRRVNDSGVRGGYDGAFYSRRTVAAEERVPFVEQQRGVERATRAFSGDSGMRGGGVRGTDLPGSAPAPDGGMRGARSADPLARDSGTRDSGTRDSGTRDSGVRGDNAVRGDSAVRGGGENTGWRRLGDRPTGSDAVRGLDTSGVRGGGTRGEAGAPRTPTDGNGWRRFGEPGTRGADAPAAVPGSNSGGANYGGANYGGVRGDSGQSLGREIDPGSRGSSSDGNGWRRFGSPANPDAGAVRGSGSAGGYTDNTREYGRGARSGDNAAPSPDRGSGFGGNQSDGVRGSGSTGGFYRQSPSVDSNQAPARNSDSGFGSYRERSGGAVRSDPIRVNPPVLRDRSDSGWRAGREGSSPAPDSGGSFGGSRGSRAPDGGGQYRSVPAYGGGAPSNGGGSGGGGAYGGMRGGGGEHGGGNGGGGMRGGDRSAPSVGNSGGSRGSDAGGSRSGGGRRGN